MENEEEITEKDVTEEKSVEEKVVKQDRIQELEKQISELTVERDKYKKERDEANANIRDMQETKIKSKDEFDEYFGGINDN